MLSLKTPAFRVGLLRENAREMLAISTLTPAKSVDRCQGLLDRANRIP